MLSLNKKRKCIVISFLIITTITISLAIIRNSVLETFAADAYDVYGWGEWVYFDPVNFPNYSCNESNYWTPYYQDTTCYRWFLIEEDNSSQSALNLILDHDLTTSTWSNAQNVLNSSTNNWRGINSISIMGEEQAMDAMQIQTPPQLTLENGKYVSNSVSAVGATETVALKLSRLTTSSLYYDNGNKNNTGGFWLNDSITDGNGDKWAYEVTEFGNNRLVRTTVSRGVRPIINILKTTEGLTREFTPKDISNYANSYYETGVLNNNGHTFSQLQGFTIADNNLVFYAMDDDGNGGGLTSSIGPNMDIINKKFFEDSGHGNDMTYNAKTKQLLLTGPASYETIWILNRDTLEVEETINQNSKIGFNSTVIGYDEFNDNYIFSRGLTAYLTDSNFNILYTIDMPHDSTGAGIEYHNGYLYQTSWESVACRRHDIGKYKLSYQMYCNSLPGDVTANAGGSTFINVYNAKLNQDGTPSSGFGRRVRKLVIPYNSKFGEAETISFSSSDMFIGFATRYQEYNFNSNYFRFYKFAYSNIANKININVSYIDDANSTTVIISSDDELSPLPGYTQSNDKHKLTKTVVSKTISDGNMEICDYYNNCVTETIQHSNNSYKSTQTVTFTNDSINKTYGDDNFINTATTTGDGIISYVSGDTSVAEVDTSTGEVTIKGAGTTTITATASETNLYNEGSASYILTVARAVPEDDLSDNELSDGNEDDDQDEIIVPNTSSTTDAPDTGENTRIDKNMSIALDVVFPAFIAICIFIYTRHKKSGHINFDS